MTVAVETLSIFGIESLQEGVKGATVSPVQLKPGAVTGGLTFAETGFGTLTFGQVSGDIRLRGPLSQDTVTVGVLTRVTGATSQWGRETLQGDFGLFPANVEHEAVYSANTDYLTVAIPTSDLDRVTSTYQTRRSGRFWSTGAMYRADPQQSRMLVQKARAVASVVHNTPQLLSIPEARMTMMDELLDQFFCAFGGAGAVVDLSKSNVSTPHALVRRAEDFCLGNTHRTPRICEICRELGVSERTLRRAFVSVVGVPPKKYLRCLRLTHVRRKLIESRGETARVSDIAMQHGFWELGRFSGEYQQLFGELPSRTLGQAFRALSDGPKLHGTATKT